MMAVKEKNIDMLTILSEVPEAEPTEEEMRIIKAYENGEEEYQPYISHEELKRQLNL